MFWNNLSETERDIYAGLIRKTAPWVTWRSQDPETRGPEPYIPTDQDWMEMDRLAAKGWKVPEQLRT